MRLQSNPELELAYEYVSYTNKSMFLTGKAGTGKTTFLHRIKEEGVKRMAVVAPTGVAAINAGGMTIHSFFQLPFGPFLPGNAREVARQRRFSREKIRLIRSLELLVIDEISMVRADLLDGIDEVLRRYKHPFKPFGGVQLLMIGDLHQLPPVVKEEEWYLLREHYKTPYFFSSQALQKANTVSVELKHIYRQSDDQFIRLLNRVRNNALDEDVLAKLNSRFNPDFQPPEEDGYITLTTHNASANAINAQKLQELDGEEKQFKASISGDFPAHAYPTGELLHLKTGAQVLFIKNDPSPDKLFYNGKIGKVTRMAEETIYVQCPGDEAEIAVETAVWQNVKYSLNEQSKEVSEDIIGTFTQFPLKLAWAITIHKSQGLTFERVILDAQAAFAHGQVYVALSRCKSFEGIVLCSRIAHSSVRTDATVRHFSEEVEKNAPGQAQLEQAKMEFQQSLLLELFGFETLRQYFEGLRRIFLEHEDKLHPGAIRQFEQLTRLAEEGVFPVEKKFRGQLLRLFREGGLPEESEGLQERVRKASSWFAGKVKEELQAAAQPIPIITDNRQVRKAAAEAVEKVQRELFTKSACFTLTQNGFSSSEYLRCRTAAELDFRRAPKSRPPSSRQTDAPQHTPHPELYASLTAWRNEIAEEKGVAPYQVLPARSLLELVESLPAHKAQLKSIHGIGKKRVEAYGDSLTELIQAYCESQDISPPPLPEEEVKAPKPNTRELSLQLYQSGKTIDEIAAERSLARTTIEGHLAHFIEKGELDIFGLIDPEDVEKITQFLAARPDAPLSEAKAHFEDAYSYGQLKMVQAHQGAS